MYYERNTFANTDTMSSTDDEGANFMLESALDEIDDIFNNVAVTEFLDTSSSTPKKQNPTNISTDRDPVGLLPTSPKNVLRKYFS